MANPRTLSEAAQKQAGQPIGGDMGDQEKNFCITITKLFERSEIDVTKPESFLNKDVYDRLEPEWKTKTDLSIGNIAILLNHIYEFYKSKQTPDACPQLATMIKQLWEMKQRIEVHADVFKF
ncbi:MAG: hypothetical protein PHZ00_03145 [Candidatus Peribacteraceae bacterium]|nr:hypothetical protein [Candidatus Peribacteraceae bacterium]